MDGDWQAVGEVSAGILAEAEARAEMRLRARAALDLAVALGAADPRDAVAVACAFLRDQHPGHPEVALLFGEERAEARIWADWASPETLAAYGIEVLRALRGAPTGLALRKELFVALWDSFPDADRAQFLGRVDPDGRFRRRD